MSTRKKVTSSACVRDAIARPKADALLELSPQIFSCQTVRFNTNRSDAGMMAPFGSQTKQFACLAEKKTNQCPPAQ